MVGHPIDSDHTMRSAAPCRKRGHKGRAREVGELKPDTPLFWSRWPGRKGVRQARPLHGKNIWGLCGIWQ